MTKRFLLVLVFAALLGAPLLAEGVRIAVIDFEVVTERPEYRSLGKGFAELASVRLADFPGLVLVDRARRNELLGEQAFSLSGGADEGAAVEIGRLLSANYLVTGAVVDMLGDLVVSYELVSTETGRIVGKEQVEGPPSEYKRLVREIGDGVARMAGVAAAPPRAIRPASRPESQTAVLRKYSEAVAALDTSDEETARTRIEEARALDPRDPAIAAFIAKLGAGNIRFQAEIDRYEPSYNPASLAFLERGSLFLWSSIAPPDPDSPFTGFAAPDYSGSYRPFCWRGGANLPLGRGAGISVELLVNALMWDLSAESFDLVSQVPGSDHIYQEIFDFGAQASYGRLLSPSASLGFSLRAAYSDELSDYRTGKAGEVDPYALYPGAKGFSVGASVGLVLKPDPFTVDLGIAWSSMPELFIDIPALGATGTLELGRAPLVLNLGAAYGFPSGKAIASLRGKAELFMDGRNGGAFRLMPGLEWRPLRSFGLRASYEATFLALGGNPTFGNGFIGGLSLSLGSLEINANVDYRIEPIRMLPGETYDTLMVLIGFVWQLPGKRKL